MKQQTAFTLLEVLVVLVLVSLISMLLMQGLGFVLQLRTQFVNQLDDLQQGTLQEYWFRSSTRSLFPAGSQSPFVFKGDKYSFSGLTTASLHDDIGTPVAFKWALITQQDKTKLYYYPNLINDPEQNWLVMEWFGNEGQFEYLDTEGKWFSQWPPQAFEAANQLPEAVLLTGKRRQQRLQWLVSVIGMKSAPLQINPMFDL